MKLKNIKKIILSLVVIIFTILLLGQNAIYAENNQSSLVAALSTNRYLAKNNNGQYTYESTGRGFMISASGHRIYQINEFAIENGQPTTKLTGENARIYCLNARAGETWDLPNYTKNSDGTYTESTDNISQKVTLNTSLNFKNESEIKKNYDDILTTEYYSSIVWLLDNFYIPNITDKEKFVEKMGIIRGDDIINITTGEKYYPYMNNSKYKFLSDDIDEFGYVDKDQDGNFIDALLPDDIIETVQQAVIWYFTNYKDGKKEDLFNCYTTYYNYNSKSKKYEVFNAGGEKIKTFDQLQSVFDYEGLVFPSWLHYNTDSNQEYEQLNYLKSDKDANIEIGKMYQQQAAILYNYLVDGALEAKASNYQQTESTISISKGSAKLTKDGENYKYGPIKINTTGTVSNIELTITDKNSNTIGKIQDENNNDVTNIVADKNYYITNISQEYEGNINIKVTATGENETTQTLWIDANKQEQPIVKIDRQNKQLEDTTSFSIEKEKYFDLALRKRIIKVKNAKDQEISILNESGRDATRNITVDPSTIPNTATYKHRKDPVVVGMGYKVTYELNIYNEGDINGYASIIIDQLPMGLESTLSVGSTVISTKGNTYEVESLTDNKLKLKLTSTSPVAINAYSTEIDKDTIELECKVTQKEDTSTHYLTNIAYINEAKNANGKVQEQDRNNTESKPSQFPDYSANSLNNTQITYEGNANNQSINNDTNNDYYYAGQEDDDDFETIVIPAKEFDLKLVKYISAVNGDTSKGKTVTGIDTTGLASRAQQTANYTLSKDVVTVQKGDYVTYTFRVYNEGELDGYLTKISDNIPLGLQFVQKSIENDGKTITVYNYDVTNGLTSSNIEVASNIYELVDSNNSFWTIDKDQDENLKTDSYNGDTTPSVSLNVEGYRGGTNKLLSAYDASKDVNNNGAGLDYIDLTLVLKVSDTASFNKIIRNEAAITGHTDKNGNSITDRDSQPENWYGKDDHENYQDDEDYDNIKLVRFDISLRKFITAVSSSPIKTTQDGQYNTDDNKTVTIYNNRIPEVDTSKLKTGEDETAIYNHSKEAIQVKQGDYVIYTIRVYNEGELNGYASSITDYLPEKLSYVDGDFNEGYGWSYDANSRKVTTRYLAYSEGTTSNLLEAFDRENDDGKGSGLSYKDVKILCRVSEEAVSGQNITNIAEITEYQTENGTVEDNDPDSNPSNLTYPEDVSGYEGNRKGKNASDTYYPGQEDDDDFDRVVILKGSYNVYLIKQNEKGEQLNSEATFKVNDETKTVTGILKIADNVEINKENVDQKDSYRIEETKAPNGYSKFNGIITVDVTKKRSSDKYEIDSDSIQYKITDENNNEITTEDAKVYLKDGDIYIEVKDDELKFDLALRKFITNISGKDVTTRIPKVSYEDGKINYTHSKDVVNVVVGDVVTYTIRVYNEGITNGYAETITDDIPEYLEYLPKNATNVSYRWKMYDKDGKETEKVSNATKIVTDYTSKSYGEKMMQDGKDIKENPNLLKAFDSSKEISDTNPQYVDVKVAFKVKDPNSSKYVIKNKAQISEDCDEDGNPVDDIDSVPNQWNEGEDDQDYENVAVQYFDLSLLKYVSEVEVTEKGKTTTTKTGNKGDEKDIIPKVEIHRKNLKSTTVKFIYTIKVTNEGDIPGYVKEITDYVPDGLKFYKEDNKGWNQKSNGVITTELLSDTLLNPGESATVKVTFRWINDENNLGVKTNIAEISDDYNEKEVPDRDSTPGNKKEGEDDIDDADVLLSIKTGLTENVIGFIAGATIILVVLASGVILIKKFVL